MHEWDCDPAGFEWIDCGDAESSVVSLIRRSKTTPTIVLAVCNFTPVPRYSYRLGAPRGGFWIEALNSDAADYGGSNMGNMGGVEAAPVAHHGRPYSLTITLPPLSVSFFKNEG
jgi:1,4-alpha-glucan branching enzyme